MGLFSFQIAHYYKKGLADSMSKDSAKLHYERGLIHLHKNDYERASEFFLEAIDEDPEYTEALYNLAGCCSMQGKVEDALSLLAKAVKLNDQCAKWAKEDHEFFPIKNDPRFERVLNITDSNENSLTETETVTETFEEESEFEETPYNEADALSMVAADESEVEADEEEIVDEFPEDIPQFEDPTVKVKKKPPPPKSDFPPCAICGGIVKEERKLCYSPFLSLGIILLGMLLTVTMFVSYFALFLGLPLICIGLFLLIKVEDLWICQNCGNTGERVGQPPK